MSVETLFHILRVSLAVQVNLPTLVLYYFLAFLYIYILLILCFTEWVLEM